MNSISAVIITLNEADVLDDCLKSIEWCDEIVVVDSHSDDQTVKIAEHYTDRIIQYERVGYVEPIRGFAAEQITGDFVLRIDADERVPESLAHNLQELAQSDADIIMAPRKNYLMGKWVNCAGWWPDYTAVMYRPDSVIHRDELHFGLEIQDTSSVIRLDPTEKNALVHHNHASVSQWVTAMNRYSDIHAGEMEFSPKLFIRGYREFIYRFILQSGYKLGVFGLSICIARCLYWHLVAWKSWMDGDFGTET